MLAEQYLFVQVSSGHVRGQLWVNGCTAWQAWDARPTVTRTPVAPFMRPVGNELTLLLSDAAPPREGPASKEEPYLELELGLAGFDAPAQEFAVIFSYTWTDEDSRLGPEPLTRVVEHRLDLPDARAWAWDRGRALDEERDRRGIETVVAKLHGLIEKRDTKELVKMLALKHTELATGWRASRDDVEGEILGELADLYAEPDFTVEPLRLDRLLLERRCGGRLVHVRDMDGRPPIRATAAGKAFALPLGLACLDDAWLVVR